MICSMTGFAEKSVSTSSLSVKIGIKTLNHRFFDWNFHGPPAGGLEEKLRVICQNKISRGRVDVFFDLFTRKSDAWDLFVNEGLFQKILDILQKTSEKTGKDFHFSLDHMFAVPHIVEMSKRPLKKAEQEFLESAFTGVLEKVIASRRREGRSLEKDLKVHLKNMKTVLPSLEKAARGQPAAMKAKLAQRIKELSGEEALSEDRLIEEAAYYAQRYDLAEELARLKSHLDFAGKLLSPQKDGPVGKKLDFIAQELYRETNTINSKSQDIRITRLCLELKSEIESLRQQVQNIE